MTVWFALCPGANARLCAGCGRNAERHPAAAAAPHQATIAPAYRNGRCARWMAPRGQAVTPTDRRA